MCLLLKVKRPVPTRSMKKVCTKNLVLQKDRGNLSSFSHVQVRGDPYTNLVRAENESQVAKWKAKESGFFLKDKEQILAKGEARFTNTNFKPILIEEVSRN